MNLQNQSVSCPIINNCVPGNCDEIAAELCKLYYDGKITDDQTEYDDQYYINMIKATLAERGQDDKFVETIKATYKENIFKSVTKEDLISDEEEQKILDEFQTQKRK